MKKTARATLLQLIVILSVLAPAAIGVYADGMMMTVKAIGKSTRLVSSPRQEALLIVDDDTTQVVLPPHFNKGPKELAWVVPFPAQPTNIEQCDDKIFETLEKETVPQFQHVEYKDKGHWGCGCGVMMHGKNARSVSPVIVKETGVAGMFKYVVLSASKGDDLARWLKEHDYHIPDGAERVFARYTKLGWYWLAMRIRPGLSDLPVLAPHPITYTYKCSNLIYPLVISQFSAAAENEIVLYVLAKKQYACVNWNNMTINEIIDGKIKEQSASPSGTNYEELFHAATKKNKGHLFVTEYAVPMGEYQLNGITKHIRCVQAGMPNHLTRLRAIMAPAAMDRDVELAPTPDKYISNQYNLAAMTSANHTLPLAMIISAVCVAFLGVRLFHHTGWLRFAGSVCISFACLILAMG